jgi:hypothetical protein
MHILALLYTKESSSEIFLVCISSTVTIERDIFGPGAFLNSSNPTTKANPAKYLNQQYQTGMALSSALSDDELINRAASCRNNNGAPLWQIKFPITLSFCRRVEMDDSVQPLICLKK